MIFAAFFRALGQIGDPHFRRVFWIGVVLSLALLVGVYALFLLGIQWLVPDSVNIPLVGPVGGLHTLLSWGSALFMLGLSIFLMVPVASAFSGLFLEDVVQAVEAQHYPGLPPAPRIPLYDVLRDTFNFFMLLVALNLLAVVVFILVGPLAPVAFWLVNGLLLGREYFMLVAMRRLGREGAKVLRRENSGTILLAGFLMAAPLSIPLVNLAIPVLGAATFTHLFHMLIERQARG